MIVTLPPGSVIGILGGGQLGRMTALAAARLGFCCHIFTPTGDNPACKVTDLATIAAYDDKAALAAFASQVDVITYEFENIPLATGQFLTKRRPMCPNIDALAISQHRGSEKRFAADNNVPVAPYRLVGSRGELSDAIAEIGLPAVLKTCRLGYDGKGQVILRTPSDLDTAWHSLASDDTILEGFIPFEREISVIVARAADGATRPYPAVENRHVDHILDTTIAPAPVREATAATARNMAVTLANALDLVGLLAVEMFVLPDGQVLMNEIAPRPHNSGHWTQDGAATCQFEQLVRAVTGQPLGPPDLIAPTVMRNLIGESVAAWPSILAEPGVRLHLYGKVETRPGRKMGHVNRVTFD